MDEASSNLPHPQTLWKTPCGIHRITVIHWSNVGPDLRGDATGGQSGVEIGAALSDWVVRAALILLHRIAIR
jgi:hypothetical protein